MTRTKSTPKLLTWVFIALAGLAHQACATAPRPSTGSSSDQQASVGAPASAID